MCVSGRPTKVLTSLGSCTAPLGGGARQIGTVTLRLSVTLAPLHILERSSSQKNLTLQKFFNCLQNLLQECIVSKLMLLKPKYFI